MDQKGTVLLPAYVPGGLVTTFLTAGFDVRYYPVESDLSIDPGRFRERLDTVGPAAVVFIHYLGFADENYPTLHTAASNRDSFIIEDCSVTVLTEPCSGTRGISPFLASIRHFHPSMAA